MQLRYCKFFPVYLILPIATVLGILLSVYRTLYCWHGVILNPNFSSYKWIHDIIRYYEIFHQISIVRGSGSGEWWSRQGALNFPFRAACEQALLGVWGEREKREIACLQASLAFLLLAVSALSLAAKARTKNCAFISFLIPSLPQIIFLGFFRDCLGSSHNREDHAHLRWLWCLCVHSWNIVPVLGNSLVL